MKNCQSYYWLGDSRPSLLVVRGRLIRSIIWTCAKFVAVLRTVTGDHPANVKHHERVDFHHSEISKYCSSPEGV